MVELKRVTVPGVRKSPLFPQAVVCHPFIFVSGQVAFNEQGAIVGEGDCAAQTEIILSNIKMILEGARSGMQHIAKITCYLTSASNYDAYNKTRQRWLGSAPPASTTIIVAALVRPELLIEIDTVALIPEAKKD